MKAHTSHIQYDLCGTILVIFLSVVWFSVPLFAADKAEKWQGVDEAVVEKIAREHGREASKPLINTDQGDLLLFVFLTAGTVGGFTAGYFWRTLMDGRKTKQPDQGKSSQSPATKPR